MNSNLRLIKCERCSAEFELYKRRWCPSSYNGPHYCICIKCYNKWFDDGYNNTWCAFHYRDNNDELANKFVLDFIGKLD